MHFLIQFYFYFQTNVFQKRIFVSIIDHYSEKHADRLAINNFKTDQLLINN